MRTLALAVVLCCGCGPTVSKCDLQLGVSTSTLSDLRSDFFCTAHPYRGALGPVDDLRCCLRKRTDCSMSCTPAVTAHQVGPGNGDGFNDSSWCCIYVQDGVVVGRAVTYD